MTETVIGAFPNDGREWDVQCARCGSSLEYEACEECCGEGWIEDDDWQNYEGEIDQCNICLGACSFPRCCSSVDYCKANPRPGREAIEGGTPEWFLVEPLPAQKRSA